MGLLSGCEGGHSEGVEGFGGEGVVVGFGDAGVGVGAADVEDGAEAFAGVAVDGLAADRGVGDGEPVVGAELGAVVGGAA